MHDPSNQGKQDQYTGRYPGYNIGSFYNTQEPLADKLGTKTPEL
jgi:hypothetical protein